MITMMVGTNVVKAIMTHAGSDGRTSVIGNFAYLGGGLLLGFLIVLCYFELSMRTAKQHGLDQSHPLRGILWLWSHQFLVSCVSYC